MAFRPINPPHNWRQVDTVGVAMRYWSRWTVENASFPEALYPAVLLSGDTAGIMAQEFPLLNLMMAPAFALGDYWGRIGAHLIFIAILSGLFWWNLRLWRYTTILGVPGELMILLLPAFSFIVPYWGRVIPDVIAALLVTAGVGAWWRDDLKTQKLAIVGGAALIAIGILIKPPAVVGVALLLLHPRLGRNFALMGAAGAAALLPAILYYTKGIAFLKSLEEGQGLFAVDRKELGEAWRSVATDWHGLIEMLAKEPFNRGGLLVLALLAVFFHRRLPALGRASFAFIVALLMALSLAGNHVFVHSYYLAAIAPICAIVLLIQWGVATNVAGKQGIFGKIVMVLLMLGTFFTYLPLDFFGWTTPGRPADLFAQCESLKREAHAWPWKQGLVFRSSLEPYPLLGLCFGEREGSAIATKGFFFNQETLPAGCRADFQSQDLLLATCEPS